MERKLDAEHIPSRVAPDHEVRNAVQSVPGDDDALVDNVFEVVRQVVRTDIKNLRVAVHQPLGRVRVPTRLRLDGERQSRLLANAPLNSTSGIPMYATA